MSETVETTTQTDSSVLPNTPYVLHRRFDRMSRLVGAENMEKLFRTHVMVIGVGGVGSMAAESLARSGVGKITLVDHDEVCITNTNRQIHAMQGMIGRKKATVMAERLKKINPMAEIVDLPQVYTAETSDEVLASNPDFIIDAIDTVSAKVHLLARAYREGRRIICSTGAGSRIDPLAIRLADLSETHTDPLAAVVRKNLRGQYDLPNDKAWGIPAVFSTEIARDPITLPYDKNGEFQCVCPQGKDNPFGCDRRNVIHGTASFVTGQFGLVQASVVIRAVSEGLGPKGWF